MLALSNQWFAIERVAMQAWHGGKPLIEYVVHSHSRVGGNPEIKPPMPHASEVSFLVTIPVVGPLKSDSKPEINTRDTNHYHSNFRLPLFIHRLCQCSAGQYFFARLENRFVKTIDRFE